MLGVSMILISIVEMGPALSPWPQPPKNNNNNNKGLVTKGLYAEVRHPMYTGLLATSVGLSIVSDSATRLLLSLVLWYILDVKTNKEEEFLMEAYSKDYAKYKQQVPNKFLPKIVVDNLPSWGD
jgi:protein-S-isoprenylcysteine O-methyltransferase Ste14